MIELLSLVIVVESAVLVGLVIFVVRFVSRRAEQDWARLGTELNVVRKHAADVVEENAILRAGARNAIAVASRRDAAPAREMRRPAMNGPTVSGGSNEEG